MEHISTVLCCGELRTIKLTLIRHEGLRLREGAGIAEVRVRQRLQSGGEQPCISEVSRMAYRTML